MTKPNVTDLSSIQNFRKERGELEKEILKFNSLTGRSNLFVYVSRFYKTIAQNTQDKEIKNNATTEAEYFLEQAVKYGQQYLTQKEMLPEFFDVDKPVEAQR